MSVIQGVLHVFAGSKLLLQPGIRRYLALPIVINFTLFTLFIAFGITRFDSFVNNWLPTLPDWLQWIDWLIWPLFLTGFLALGFFVSLMLANVIAAPFNGFLAEAVARHLNPELEPPAAGLLELLRSTGPALVSELKKLVYFAVRALPILILFAIPGLNLIAPFIWLMFSAWLLAQEYLDYPLASQNILFTEQRSLLRRRRGCVFGLGATLLLLTMVPVINFFVMPIAVAGATHLAVREDLIGRQ